MLRFGQIIRSLQLRKLRRAKKYFWNIIEMFNVSIVMKRIVLSIILLWIVIVVIARKWGEATSIVPFVTDIFALNAITKVKLVI